MDDSKKYVSPAITEWMVWNFICSNCGYEQVSVFPVQCDFLQCHSCDEMVEIPEEVFEAYETYGYEPIED